MKKIPLNRGLFALVDDDDYEYLSQYRWRVHKDKNTCYACTNTNGLRIRMHRMIMNARAGYDVDHIDGDGLNNQKQNLREVTRRQNAQNIHMPTSSIFPGVSWHKKSRKWQANAVVDGKKKWIGQYGNEEEAFAAYCEFVQKVLGEEVIFDPSIPKTKTTHEVMDDDIRQKTSRFPGVHWKKSHNKWCAQIRVKRKCICLGYFENEADAFDVYIQAKNQIKPGYEQHIS